MDLVEVDPVGLQAAQAVLDGLDDPAARVAPVVRVVAHLAVHLAGEHDPVALAAGEGLADDLLRLALRVHVGGVDEVDPRVERPVDDPDRLVVVGVAPRAEHHRPEAHRSHLHSGPAERAQLHGPDDIYPGAATYRCTASGAKSSAKAPSFGVTVRFSSSTCSGRPSSPGARIVAFTGA